MKFTPFFSLAPLLVLSAALNSSAAELLVTNDGDAGAGSLRAALAAANGNGEADVITFGATLRGATIVLLDSELLVSSEVRISGFSDADLTISGNQSHRIFNSDVQSQLTLERLTLIDGLVENQGAGVFSSGQLLVQNCQFRGHSARVGSCIANVGGEILVTDCLFEDNFATDDGAGIDSNGTTSQNPGRVSRCTFRNNRVNANGGAFASFGPFVVEETTFTNNSALMNGGAIFNGNDLLLLGCTFSGNEATDNGGAIENRGAPFRMANCTFSGNSATEGGAISSRFSLECVNGTFANNTGTGGASALIFVEAGNMRLANSLFSGGNEPQVTTRDETAVFLLGQNLASGPSFESLANVSNRQNISNNTDALLLPLADNGGFVQTHRLAPASPAIDRGVNRETLNFLAGPTLTDARGVPRFLRASPTRNELRTDLGALEEIPAVSLTGSFASNPLIEVAGIAGNRYELLTSPGLSPDSFTVLTTFTLGDGGVFAFEDERQPQLPRGFFRLRVVNGFE